MLLAAALSGGSVQALDSATPEEVAQLASRGFAQLALRRINAAQPGPEQDSADWAAWERERLQILFDQRRYREVVDRTSDLPQAIDAQFPCFALTLRARSLLALRQTRSARAAARELLWVHNRHADRAQLEEGRRLIVRTYLLEGLDDDAELAVRRYGQDFGTQAPQWMRLNARVMLQRGQPQSAFRLLENESSTKGRLLRSLAELEAFPDRAARIASTAAEQAQQAEEPALKRAYWMLAARAARRAGEPFDEIRYLEHALSLPHASERTLPLAEVDADQLWDRYLEVGKHIGNQEQRLIGRDEDWYFPATEALQEDPLRARVLFSVLAESGSTQQSRALAHEYLVGMLDELVNGRTLVRRMYLDSARYAEVESLPAVIRWRLIDDGLESGQVDAASRLIKGLSAPAGTNAFEWDLRRARVKIYTGDVDGGAAVLKRLLSTDAQPGEGERIDRLLEVILDLQAVRAHESALALLTSMLEKPHEAQQRRELLFWMAESAQALERHDEAAYLYLKAADSQAM
ncbi:MAG: hypothetical protein PVI91_10755, partial [Gammaproteobacteria bacterium]